MTFPPAADQDAAPPSDTTRPVAGWRRFLDNEPLLYCLIFSIIVGFCLLIPALLNNMIFTFVMLMLGVWLVPQLLKKRPGGRTQDEP